MSELQELSMFTQAAIEEAGRRRLDTTRTHLCGTPLNFLTAMKWPSHDPDVFGYLGIDTRPTLVRL